MITAKNFLRVWTVLMFTEFTYTNSYEFKCPEPSQRIKRSKWFCNTKPETYSCLLDLQLHAYTESCSCSFDFVRPGQKYVVSGYCKNMNCSEERYQPFKFYSSELSQCAFTKSLCSDKGLLKVNVGSTREDDACRCDSTEGYTFVSRPTNNRFCTPEQEDCSCYVPTCPTNNTFSNDFDCRLDSISMSVTIDKTQLKEKEVVTIEYFDDYKYNVCLPTKKYRIVAAICVKALFLIALALNLVCARIRASGHDWSFGTSMLDFTDISTIQSEELHDNLNAEKELEDKNEVNFDEEDDAQNEDNTKNSISNETPRLIDMLEERHSYEWGQQEESVFQIIKSKDYKCEKVQTFLLDVLSTFQTNDHKHEINILEGISLLRIIADTSVCINEQLFDCIKIPAEFLKYIGIIREKTIIGDDILPTDVNEEIKNAKTLFKKLDDEFKREKKHKYYLEIACEIAKYVESLQKDIHNLIHRKFIGSEFEVNRVKHQSKLLINIYMDVQFLRSVYCIQFYCDNASYSEEKSTLLYDELENIKEAQRMFLKVFGQPKYENVAFFALFNPSEYQFITEYLAEYGVTLQNLNTTLNDEAFAMESQKWPGYSVVMSSNPWGTIWSTKSPFDKPSLLFTFESISKTDNIFFIKSVKWPTWFVWMKQAASLRGRNSKQGLKREWKIIRLEDKTVMICSQKWPCKFIYMKDALLGEVLASYEYPEKSSCWDLIHENEFHM